MKKYVQLIRMKHWIKNFLIFLPLIFSKAIFDFNKLILGIIAFFSFSFIASAVYIFNDLHDVENDKKHVIKKNRPIASGKVKPITAKIVMLILVVLSLIIGGVIFLLCSNIKSNIIFFMLLFSYFIINVAYSRGLKNKPIIDVVILCYGFVVRVFIGSVVTGIPMSNYLYLTIMASSFFMGFGKRRNELVKKGNITRAVLEKYNKNFLDKFMYIYLTLTIVFYSIWCMDVSTIDRVGNNYMIWTIPLLLIALMKYCLIIEGDSFGDPVDIILGDRLLLGILFIECILIGLIIYVI